MSKGKCKTAREILEDVYCEDGRSKKVVVALTNLQALLLEKCEAMKGQRLCGKGYENCNSCPYKDCETKIYYFKAIDQISEMIRKEIA